MVTIAKLNAFPSFFAAAAEVDSEFTTARSDVSWQHGEFLYTLLMLTARVPSVRYASSRVVWSQSSRNMLFQMEQRRAAGPRCDACLGGDKSFSVCAKRFSACSCDNNLESRLQSLTGPFLSYSQCIKLCGDQRLGFYY